MRWIDGSDVALNQFSGEKLCEKLALEMGFLRQNK